MSEWKDFFFFFADYSTGSVYFRMGITNLVLLQRRKIEGVSHFPTPLTVHNGSFHLCEKEYNALNGFLLANRTIPSTHFLYYLSYRGSREAWSLSQGTWGTPCTWCQSIAGYNHTHLHTTNNLEIPIGLQRTSLD